MLHCMVYHNLFNKFNSDRHLDYYQHFVTNSAPINSFVYIWKYICRHTFSLGLLSGKINSFIFLIDITKLYSKYFFYFLIFYCCSSTFVSISPHLPPLILPPFGFVHGSFIYVPWQQFPFFPPLSPTTFPCGCGWFILFKKNFIVIQLQLYALTCTTMTAGSID